MKANPISIARAPVFGLLLFFALAAAPVASLRGQSLEFVGSVATPGNAKVVAVSGNVACVVDDSASELQIIDVSDPSAPAIRSSFFYPFSGHAVDVAMSGSLAYVTYGKKYPVDFGGVRVVDVSSPAAPVERGNFIVGPYPFGEAGSIAVSGALAYVVVSNLGDGRGAGLSIVDMTNPLTPIVKGTISGAGGLISLAGNQLLVLRQGLDIFDLSDPTAPSLLAYYAPVAAEIVSASGDGSGRILAALGGSNRPHVGIHYLALSGDLSAPALVSARYTRRPVRSVQYAFLNAPLVFAAVDTEGVQLFNLSLGISLIPRGSFDTSGVALDLAVQGSLVYVADGPGGLVILRTVFPPAVGN